MLVFCLLDRAVPYEKACAAWQILHDNGLDKRHNIRSTKPDNVAKLLSAMGFRFPNQAGKYIYEFGQNPIDLRTATREELVEQIPGIGYKLASMFLNRTRGATYAILDVHIKRWLEEKGYDVSKPYEVVEQYFFTEAAKLNKDPNELDLEIWEERRIGNRNKSLEE